MLDIKFIESNLNTVKENLAKRNFDIEEIDKIEQGIIKTAKYLNEAKPFLKINQK